VTPDGRKALVGSEKGEVALVDLASGALEDTWDSGRDATITAFAFVSPTRFACSHSRGHVELVEIQEGRLVVKNPDLADSGARSFVGATPGGQVLFVDVNARSLIDPVSGERKWRRVGGSPAGGAHGLAISPDGRFAVITWLEGCLQLIALDDGAEVDRLEFAAIDDVPTTPVFSPDGHFLAVGTERGAVLWFEVSR
jgi:hypothetical protein